MKERQIAKSDDEAVAENLLMFPSALWAFLGVPLCVLCDSESLAESLAESDNL